MTQSDLGRSSGSPGGAGERAPGSRHSKHQGPAVGPGWLRVCGGVARRPLYEEIWPGGTLLLGSQGLRPGGRARARPEEMGPRPWPADSPGAANIPSAGDETQSRVAGGGGPGLHKQPRPIKQIKAAQPSPGHFLQARAPSSWEGASWTRSGGLCVAGGGSLSPPVPQCPHLPRDGAEWNLWTACFILQL